MVFKKMAKYITNQVFQLSYGINNGALGGKLGAGGGGFILFGADQYKRFKKLFLTNLYEYKNYNWITVLHSSIQD